MPEHRRQARVLAMQALCQWDVQHSEQTDELREFLTVAGEGDISDRVADYGVKLVTGFWSQRSTIDELLGLAATNWRLGRISPVERNIMRVAVVEVLGEDVPMKVALNEAIEIGRVYGGAESWRFINGVLDVVLKRVQQKKEGD